MLDIPETPSIHLSRTLHRKGIIPIRAECEEDMMKKSGGCALPAIVLSNENSEWGQRQPFKGSVRRYRAPSGERPISREGKRCHAHPLYSRAFLGLRLIRHLTWQVRPLIGPAGGTGVKHSRGGRTVQTS